MGMTVYELIRYDVKDDVTISFAHDGKLIAEWRGRDRPSNEDIENNAKAHGNGHYILKTSYEM